MGAGLFTGKECKPTLDELLRSSGSASGLLKEILFFIKENYQIEGELKYYGSKTGWALRFRKAGKALIMFFFEEDGLKAQIVLNPEQTQKALASALSPLVDKMLRDAKVYHDGRWLFINVKSERDVDDITKLLKAKRKPLAK